METAGHQQIQLLNSKINKKKGKEKKKYLER
jgi:hypothetical protein